MFRVQFGLVLIHLALDSKFTEIRRNSSAVVVAATTCNPLLTNQIIREGLASFLAPGLRTQQSTSDDTLVPRNTHARLSGLLLCAVSFAEETESFIREEVIVELIVFVHHRLICPSLISGKIYGLLIVLIGRSDRQIWIDLCHKAGLDPPKLIEKYLERLLQIVLENSLSHSEVKIRIHFSVSNISPQPGAFRGKLHGDCNFGFRCSLDRSPSGDGTVTSRYQTRSSQWYI
jgi:hypothetical protein